MSGCFCGPAAGKCDWQLASLWFRMLSKCLQLYLLGRPKAGARWQRSFLPNRSSLEKSVWGRGFLLPLQGSLEGPSQYLYSSNQPEGWFPPPLVSYREIFTLKVPWTNRASSSWEVDRQLRFLMKTSKERHVGTQTGVPLYGSPLGVLILGTNDEEEWLPCRLARCCSKHSVSQHCLLKRWPTCRFLLTNSSAGFMVLPTSVVNTGAKSHGWERKMPHESPRKLRSWGSLEASLTKGLWEMRFWGDTTVSSSILPTPKSRKRAVASEFVTSLLLKKSFLLFLFLFLFSGAPLFLVLRDRAIMYLRLTSNLLRSCAWPWNPIFLSGLTCFRFFLSSVELFSHVGILCLTFSAPVKLAASMYSRKGNHDISEMNLP